MDLIFCFTGLFSPALLQMLRRRRHLCVIVCLVDGELPVYPLYSKKGLIWFVRVCLPPPRARFCLRPSCGVANNLLPLSLCAAPITACPLHLLCITATRSESYVAPAAPNFLLLPSGSRQSPAVLPSPPHSSNLTSLPFLDPVLSSSALPPSAHTCARSHPPCLFSSAGSTLQPTLKRRSSLWLYCHRIRAHVACRFPPPRLLPPRKKKTL